MLSIPRQGERRVMGQNLKAPLFPSCRGVWHFPSGWVVLRLRAQKDALGKLRILLEVMVRMEGTTVSTE